VRDTADRGPKALPRLLPEGRRAPRAGTGVRWPPDPRAAPLSSHFGAKFQIQGKGEGVVTLISRAKTVSDCVPVILFRRFFDPLTLPSPPRGERASFMRGRGFRLCGGEGF